MNSSDKIHRLRLLCGGVGDNPWYSHLGPVKNCEVLLSVKGFGKALNDPLKSSSSWVKMADALLPLVDRSEKFKITFTNLLNLILDHKGIDGREEFLSRVWKYSESSTTFSALNIIDLEGFIKKEPKYLEMKLIYIVEEIIKNKTLHINELCKYWNDKESYSILIRWCLGSSFIFSVVTSIMNEILLRFSGENFIKILNLINSFLYNLLKSCHDKGKEFLSLYPWQYRHLVYLLRCKPLFQRSTCNVDSEERIMGEITAIIQDELKTRPKLIIALLSHNVSWQEIL